jgi:predicted NACHT family NTPase
MSEQPPSDPPQQNIKIDDSSFDKTQIAIAGGNSVQNQGLVNLVVNLFGKKESYRQELPNWRDELLKEVKQEVKGIIARSLHENVRVNLCMEEQLGQVRRYWDREVKVSEIKTEQLPLEKKIIDFFDENNGKILILGAAGAGKTLTMLEIAIELINRAKTSGQPMPVFLNLSYWKKDQNIASWLVDEIQDKYRIPKDISQRWIDQRQLIPLLDDLNRVDSTRQDKCVTEINQFWNDLRPPGIVVCSRQEDEIYKTHYKSKLKLNNSVLVKPLNESQLQTYLEDDLGLSVMWERIEHNPALLNLARTPFLLKIIILAYRDKKILHEEWQRLDAKEHLQHLFNDFVDRKLKEQDRSIAGSMSPL